jgi:hypothetical protein
LVIAAIGTVSRCPSRRAFLRITFTDDELGAVRAAAGREKLPLRTFAHQAVIAAASECKGRVVETATLIAQLSAELNRRFA